MEDLENRLAILEKENIQLKEQLAAVNDTIHEFYSIFKDIIAQTQNNMKQSSALSIEMNRLIAGYNNLKYEVNDPQKKDNNFFYPLFRSNEETLRLIIEEKKSLARFGDGEFSIVFKIPRQKFQRIDERLANRIWEVINSEHSDLIIAIAEQYGNLERFNDQGALGIRLYMTEETRRQHQQILPADKVYSDAYVTRPYVLYKDVFTEEPQKRFNALKEIWRKKKIMIVEGAQTRLGVGNDLFDDSASLKRIVGPATSSFDRYDDILEECKKHADAVDLFLLAIGPSSGVLAYDLTKEGIQAVDVGHIDLEYEWFLAGEGKRVSVPHKYNNEVIGGEVVEPLYDPSYEMSIVAKFE